MVGSLELIGKAWGRQPGVKGPEFFKIPHEGRVLRPWRVGARDQTAEDVKKLSQNLRFKTPPRKGDYKVGCSIVAVRSLLMA